MYHKKCEVCGGVISDERRFMVGNSPDSQTCSIGCEHRLRTEIAKLNTEGLIELAERGRHQFGAETNFTVRRELERRRIRLTPENVPVNIGNLQGNTNLKTCYACGSQTDSLKDFRMLNWFFFLVIFISAQGMSYKSCPSCMRKKIFERAAVNILPANVVFPIIFVMFFVQFCRTFVRGHSI